MTRELLPVCSGRFRLRRGVVTKVSDAFDFDQHGPARLSFAASLRPTQKEGRNQLPTSATPAAAASLCLRKFVSIFIHLSHSPERTEDEKVGHDSPVGTILSSLPHVRSPFSRCRNGPSSESLDSRHINSRAKSMT